MLRTSGAAVDSRRVAVTCFNLTNAILDPWTYPQPGLRTKMRIGTRERGLTWSNVTGSGKTFIHVFFPFSLNYMKLPGGTGLSHK